MANYLHRTSRTTHWGRRLLCGVLMLLNSVLAHAKGEVLLVLSDISPSYEQVKQAVQDSSHAPVRVVTLDRLQPQDSRNSLIVAIGSRACEQMLRTYHPGTRMICSFLPSSTFKQLRSTLLPGSADINISAIFIDQPLARQVRLARMIGPSAEVLGTALGQNSQDLKTDLEQYAASEVFTLALAELKSSDNPIQVLTPVVESSDLFLVIPDSSIFNRAISKWLLYLSLKHQVPVIGFSKSYTDAGATASVHSSPHQIGQQTGEWLNKMAAGEPLPAQAYPVYFEVSINPVAARTLGLELPTPAALQRQLSHIEAAN